MKKENYLAIRQLSPKNDSSKFLAANIIVDIAILFMLYTISQQSNLWLLLSSSILVAILSFRAFSMMHEGVHSSISKNLSINDGLGNIYGALCALPFDAWKKSHLEHHFWSGNIEKDPVMAILIKWPMLNKQLKYVLSFTWRTWFPILACMQQLVFWSLSFKNLIQAPSAKRSISFFMTVGFWSLVFLKMPNEFIFLGVLPGLVLYFMAVEVVNLPHHLHLNYNIGSARFPAWQQDLTARTCVYPRWIEQLITLNFNYHVEHHMFPDAPWHELRNIHNELKVRNEISYQVDQYFNWIILNKRRSLQDVLMTSTKFDTGSEQIAS